ncbi:MAG: 2-amino-4-hydroxy-6-hydroxymethyldihydropteridine diphosphokinase [Oscillospiraceae bacterium]|nr:2-amino-4-hydroxy-6-hydroxymethyldihydropteridine diphosphokinase [Oscillospiraceae bacterium]
MDHITIENLQVYAHHGVLPEETALGQRFLVTAMLYLDTRKAGRSDALSQSVNYAEVSQFITTFLQEHTFRLIESAAEHLTQALLLTYPLLDSVELTLKKPWAPVGLPLDTVSVTIQRGWHTAFVAMGSNLGDKQSYLDHAVSFLSAAETVQVLRVSDYLVTKPYGVLDQDDFLNGCMMLRTLLTPQELLALLQSGEQAAHRERLRHWGPRTLDLDLLFYDDQVLWEPDLVVPHPEIAKRAFVLEPMVQLAPGFVHPLTRQTMAEMLSQLRQREQLEG